MVKHEIFPNHEAIMKDTSLSYRELEYPFTEEIDKLMKCFGDTEKYAQLLDVLSTYMTENNEFPYQKELLKRLSYSRANLVELMNDLYKDFQDFMSHNEAYTIHKTEIQFILRDKDQVWILGPGNLKILPRIGETVYLPSLTRDHQGASYFKVDEIIHEISGGKHIMEVHLQS